MGFLFLDKAEVRVRCNDVLRFIFEADKRCLAF